MTPPPPSASAYSASISSKCWLTMKGMPTPAGSASSPELGQEDDVAVERQAAALGEQHDHQIGGQVVLVVARAAAPDIALTLDRAERIDRPLLALHADDIGVRHQKDGPLRAVALDAGDEIGALLILREGLDRDAFLLERLLQIVDGAGLVPRRAAGVELDERAVVPEDLRLLLLPVDGALPAPRARETRNRSGQPTARWRERAWKDEIASWSAPGMRHWPAS